MIMGTKQQIKKMVPRHAWRTLQRAKADMKLKSYYKQQRKRFLNNCAGPWNSEQSEQLRGTMVYYIHRIEKGLSHQHFRDGFGRSAFSELKTVMDQWRKHGYPVDAVTYQAAQNVIRAYVRKHRAIGKPIPKFVSEWFPLKLLQRTSHVVASSKLGPKLFEPPTNATMHRWTTRHCSPDVSASANTRKRPLTRESFTMRLQLP